MRYNEYYDIQKVYDELYLQSKNKNNFYKLIEIIGSENNIRLAYRNIKSNRGSKTPGVDSLTIKDLWNLTDDEIIRNVRDRLNTYQPQPVRRIEIPKEGTNKTRPLGIPTIWDRLVQQCILQVLEPICEAKFHQHSYGFRPNRNTHHAVSRVVSLINTGRHHYCVDIDIKGFFDNVNHGKLLKQIWTLGIRDKRLISIISKMLKAEIDKKGIPTKGTPQGGILSPLLSNIVLNELDWWVSNQWETFKPNHATSKYGFRGYAKKTTRLKDGFIVRYADDFKIMCRTYSDAHRFYHATKEFLKIRLGLEISPEKSKIVNLKRNSSDFLGFKIKVIKKGSTKSGYVAKTDMSDKAMMKCKNNLKNTIKDIQRNPSVDKVQNYNLKVRGIQNYYKIATNLSKNLSKINYTLLKITRIRLKHCAKTIKFKDTSKTFKTFVDGVGDESKITMVMNIPMIPLYGIKRKNPMNFSQTICNYTEIGRKKIHNNLRAIPKDVLHQIMYSYVRNRSIEYNDNRISKYIAQYGKCYITGEVIGIDRVHCHHIIPRKNKGNDSYQNLVIVDVEVHKLIHSKDKETINKYLNKLNLNDKQLLKLNKLRLSADLPII